jgi:hypothetical protein
MVIWLLGSTTSAAVCAIKRFVVDTIFVSLPCGMVAKGDAWRSMPLAGERVEDVKEFICSIGNILHVGKQV